MLYKWNKQKERKCKSSIGQPDLTRHIGQGTEEYPQNEGDNTTPRCAFHHHLFQGAIELVLWENFYRPTDGIKTHLHMNIGQ